MTEFKSNHILINNRTSSIFTFLDNFNNFELLLPEQVTGWEATKDKCSFTIKGMALLKLVKGTKTEYNYISYNSDGEKPFAFSLHFYLTETAEAHSDVQVVLKADLNPMLKMMASRPLQNLVNIILEKLKGKMEESAQ